MSTNSSQSSFTPLDSTPVQSINSTNKCTNAMYVATYFMKINESSFQCNLCKYVGKQCQKAGHGNLVKHLTSYHPDVFQRPVERIHGSMDLFVSKKASLVFDWIDFMTLLDVPFAWANYAPTKRFFTLAPLDPRTIKKYMRKVGDRIELFVKTKVIRHKGDVKPLAMLFDMWDDGSGTKELGVFLSYPDDDYVAAEYFLLCCTPLLDETNCNGDNQIETIRVALLGLDLTWTDILVIIADNTSVNPSIARKLKIPMIGCQSHVLALAVKEYTTDYSEVISKLHNLCVTFRTPKYRGALRDEGCNNSPKIKGHKWGALYAMLSTYFNTVGDSIEVIVRANPIKDLDDRHSFTPSERNQLIQ